MMNKMIKFRGKCIETSDFRYGTLSLTDNKKLAFINNPKSKAADAYAFTYEVDVKSVGQFTGFNDINGTEIYEGDILSDWNEVDGKIVQSKMQVFWNQPTGSWHLDNSYEQDKTCSVELWLELHDFDYEVTGNVFENPELVKC